MHDRLRWKLCSFPLRAQPGQEESLRATPEGLERTAGIEAEHDAFRPDQNVAPQA
jgi:hypothetical protein